MSAAGDLNARTGSNTHGMLRDMCTRAVRARITEDCRRCITVLTVFVGSLHYILPMFMDTVTASEPIRMARPAPPRERPARPRPLGPLAEPGRAVRNNKSYRTVHCTYTVNHKHSYRASSVECQYVSS